MQSKKTVKEIDIQVAPLALRELTERLMSNWCELLMSNMSHGTCHQTRGKNGTLFWKCSDAARFQIRISLKTVSQRKHKKHWRIQKKKKVTEFHVSKNWRCDILNVRLNNHRKLVWTDIGQIFRSWIHATMCLCQPVCGRVQVLAQLSSWLLTCRISVSAQATKSACLHKWQAVWL